MNRILVFFMLIAVPLFSHSQCVLKKPTGLTVNSISSCEAHVSWNPVPGIAYYILKYKKDSSPWIFINTGTTPSCVVTGLKANTNYTFTVASFCANNQTKGYCPSVLKKTLACSEPLNPTVTPATNSATISWQPVCTFTAFNLRYRPSGASQWTIISNIAGITYQLNGLVSGVHYDYQIQAKCGIKNSTWSSTHTFTTLVAGGSKRNIMVVMVDDGRFDIYQENGGPSWFSVPAISRIAAEGVNFRITCPGTSQCGPSRATFYTGLYSHHNDCINNGDHLNPSVPLVQQILKDNGYYTGFIGKYGQGLGDPKGFNWWAVSNTDDYEDVMYTINGVDTFIAGHITDIYPELALEFLNQVPPNQSFALFYFHRAPHGPCVPRPEESNLYTSAPIPFPNNFYSYDHDYPSYYYSTSHSWPFDSAGTDSMRLLEYQVTAGVDDNVDTLMDWLEAHQILDSTLVMYTSDNGYIRGEHLLLGKEMALEESIRLPLFIRYPKWFNSSTVISDQIASNIDFAPTLLELAGIPDTFGMDGVSLHKLSTHQVIRKNFLYEFGKMGVTPSLRAVRSLQYKYIYNFCNSPVEEFYDLLFDPKENNNLIADVSYSGLIESYRAKLDSLRTTYTDIDPPTIPCYMANPTMEKTTGDDDNDDMQPVFSFNVMPDPASHYFNLQYSGRSDKQWGDMSIFNMLGERVVKQQFLFDPDKQTSVNCASWPQGVYLVRMKLGDISLSQKIMISH